jgi:hypothetical protein
MKRTIPVLACVSVAALSSVGCGAPGPSADDGEGTGQVEEPMTTYRARLLPSAYTLLMPDAMTDCGGGETLGRILESAPVWRRFTRTQPTWSQSAGAILVELAAKILHDTSYGVDEAEHTAAYWALMAAHDAAPSDGSIDVKLIAAARFHDCRAGLFETPKATGFLFVVGGARAIGDRAWYLNSGKKKVAGKFSAYSLDDALVCFADPNNFASARQQAIRQGVTTWMVADPPRSGLCARASAAGRAASEAPVGVVCD